METLFTLVEEESVNFTDAAQVIKSPIYVDDIVTSAATIQETKSLQKKLIQSLQRGGFEQRKCASNDPSLLSDIPSKHLWTETLSPNFESDNPLKILGLQWNPSPETFFLLFKL
ncbi:hypothetical protein JTB14_001113 [Gonioctena quinquepunctata]|nr:hypothetical protein JTB14_001113 [Gonioctena quinquepunctata]